MSQIPKPRPIKPSKVSRNLPQVPANSEIIRPSAQKLEAIKEALKEQQKIFESVIEHAPNGMIMVDASGKILLVNLQIEKLFGYDRNELLGQKVEILIPESLRKQHVMHRKNYGQDPSPRTMGAGRDLVGRRKDGSQISIEVGLNPLSTKEGFFVLAAITDISSRKELEKRALDAEHVAAIGKLSSHVAHEIRNPLSSISLNLDLMHDELQSLHQETKSARIAEADTLLKAIQREVEHLNDLASDYLKFSRLPKHQKESTDLEELFLTTLQLLEPEAKMKGINIVTKKTKGISIILDPKQIHQALLNLIKNSFEAMPKGGKVEISITTEEEAVTITIRDEGTGMDEATQKKIFDPFYTTKEKGTGLGLALVRQIILEHEGRIWFESTPGKGTSFFIWLPWDRKKEVISHG